MQELLVIIIILVTQNKNCKQISLDEVLNILMSGFLRGGVGFLKGTGEIIKGNSSVNREVRVGVTHVRKNTKDNISYLFYKTI